MAATHYQYSAYLIPDEKQKKTPRSGEQGVGGVKYWCSGQGWRVCSA
ncbi:TPA: hypothetical protein QHO33_003165 [Citrobacter freundii]|nr:hypothetical protein [Citrobacter freundii]HCB2472357.1 hypothetical protein [Citrobacter freundii]HCW3486766.1 hypothetical protein [Citrobacter freundii]HDQ2970273.1 hypothetical protein [Citrobacter freundii]HDT2573351.1 hypothetical protein [Citrobacter freundii]